MITKREQSKFRVAFLSGMDQIDRVTWNSICGTDYPFLRHEFLRALEHSGSVGADTGWRPHHLVLYRKDEPVGLMPLYIKSHSYGEYVFDWAWADAYHRHHFSYYPKLLSAVPFAPAGGPRLCLRDEELRSAATLAVVNAIREELDREEYSSWHLLFPHPRELPFFAELGLLQRHGCQYHWFNRDYPSFDQFLDHLSSRKRKNIRRERRRVAEQGLELTRLSGPERSDEQLQTFYTFYQATYYKRGQRGYLSPAFFREILSTMPEQLLLVLAYLDGEAVAGAFFMQGGDTLYGRYWGCLEEYECLHFEACYYQGIAHCIDHGIARFDPGAQGEHKISRGFEPVTTHSVHWIAHPGFRAAIADFLEREQAGMSDYMAQASKLLPFKKGPLTL